MKTSCLKLLSMGIIVLGIPHPVNAVDLITNGSFEINTQAPEGPLESLSPGSTIINNWTVTRDNIDYIGTAWIAAEGNYSLDLNGSPGVGGIAQTFETVIGQSYHVIFNFARNPGIGDTSVMMGVNAAGQSAQFSFDTPNPTPSNPNPQWEYRDWNFTAIDTQTTLEFFSLYTENPFGGPTLDNVSVNPLISPPIMNGSFENSPIDPGDNVIRNLVPGSTLIDGWTVTRGNIDYVGGAWLAADGTRSIDLNGSPGMGGLAKTLDTVAGQNYRVSFAMAANPAIYDPVTLGITAAGQSSQFSFSRSNELLPIDPGWQTMFWDFTAMGPQTTLEFFSLHDADLFGGPLLDKIEITPLSTGVAEVPESTPMPGFWVMVGLSMILKLVELIG